MHTEVSVSTHTPDYWRIYHDDRILAWAEAHRRQHQLLSTGVRINLDLYEQADRSAPVLIFNHGGGGYSRLFIPIAQALYQRGYTVILPDQRGQGLSEGDRGDFTVTQHVTNIVDAAHWVRSEYQGPIYMGGGSLGGGLTYYAAAAGAPVEALILHNLYDFSPGGDGLALSRLAPLARIPGFATLSGLNTTLAARVLPGLKIPYRWLGVFERMVDERAVGFYQQWSADPYPIKAVSLRYIHSLMTTPPAIPLEQSPFRALVINQTRDRMVQPEVTRRNYARLGGDKHYVEIDYGHWAMGSAFVAEWTTIVDQFLRRSG